MVRFLKHMLLFCLVLFMVYTVVLIVLVQADQKAQLGHNALFPRAGNGHSLSRFQEADTVQNVDVLVLGSSHAYRSFDPRMFAEQGLRMFNLGSSSQTPMQTQYLLACYLERMQPEMVLWAVNPDVFCSDGVESSLDLSANLPWDTYTTIWFLKTLDVRVLNALYYRWLSHLLNFSTPIEEAKQKRGDRYISGGYVMRVDGDKQPGTLPQSSCNPNANQSKAFAQCLELLEGYPVMFIETPVSRAYYDSYTARGSYLKLMEGYPFFNANTALQYPDSLFYDNQHLNAAGVEKFFFDLKNHLTLELKP